MSPEEMLPELTEIAKAAGQLAQKSREKIVREIKPDGSIVTNGDRDVETFLRPLLTALAPGSTVWGEEFGWEEEGPGGRWLVDPVDGTSNYAYGSPLWGVSIGYMKGNDILMGAVNLADLGELYISAKGAGVVCNGLPMEPIPPGEIQRMELVSYCEAIMRLNQPLPGRMRCGGAFVMDGTFVARQRYRGLIGIREKLYDIAACVLFVSELGGEVRYADGSEMHFSDLQKNQKIEKPWIMFPHGTDFILE